MTSLALAADLANNKTHVDRSEIDMKFYAHFSSFSLLLSVFSPLGNLHTKAAGLLYLRISIDTAFLKASTGLKTVFSSKAAEAPLTLTY